MLRYFEQRQLCIINTIDQLFIIRPNLCNTRVFIKYLLLGLSELNSNVGLYYISKYLLALKL